MPVYTLAPSQGWQCPACGGVYAPWMTKCTECKPKTLGERMQAAQPPAPRISGPLPLAEGAGTSAVA